MMGQKAGDDVANVDRWWSRMRDSNKCERVASADAGSNDHEAVNQVQEDLNGRKLVIKIQIA